MLLHSIFCLYFFTQTLVLTECYNDIRIRNRIKIFRLRSSGTTIDKREDVKRTLKKEYLSFFNPMYKQFYAKDVEFIDPLNSFKGVDKYQSNVDMLAGRNGFGAILFRDASIVLHSVEDVNDNRIQTRWTLQVTVKSIPWQPRAKFTGISVYSFGSDGLITKQEDYWDSINLKNGKYVSVGLREAIVDFLGQLKKENSADLAAPELPYELLRRSDRYEVRRYPSYWSCQTEYDQRPEGYDRLASYVGGSNTLSKRLTNFAPTIMEVIHMDTYLSL